ncbi:hypothetical protein AB0K60_16885 [Thermopolyspora sp. NPDC052614]|uniref:hypothetical protein n=1 Tax=Thermopolyspora sp. NPDC052614 TaxID=3155682 RepID=UPI00341A4BF0
MPRDLADLIAVHLVAAERALSEDDPDRAYEHAKVARRFGSRVGVVREAAGIAAYRAGHFAEALNDLRAARRLLGADDLLPMLADCERGLGRPERALDLVRSPEAERAGRAVQIELAIVESGARRDLGQKDAAIVTLQRLPELRDSRPRPWSARLAFAYADALADAGHDEAAADWFSRAMAFDEDGETDAAERYAQLTGMDIEDIQDIEEDVEQFDGDVEDRDESGFEETDEARDDALDEEDVPEETAEDDSERDADVASVSDARGGSGDERADNVSAADGGGAEDASGVGSDDEAAAPEAAADAAESAPADVSADLDLDEEVRAKLDDDADDSAETGDADDAHDDADDVDDVVDDVDASDDAGDGEAVSPATGQDEAGRGVSAAPAGSGADAASNAAGGIGLGPAFIEPDFGDDDTRDSAAVAKREG